MRTLEARYKSGQRCHCRCDLGEKKSPCLREAAFSYARTRAELDRKETASHEPRISRKHALSSRKLRYANSTFVRGPEVVRGIQMPA